MNDVEGWPSVAVVIPNHSRTTELLEAVRSVQQQRYPGPISIYLVYEPRPEIEALLQELGTDVVALPHQAEPTTSSIAARRNIALNASKEDLIAFLDDDDLWHPDKLRVQAQRMKDLRAVASGTAWVNFTSGVRQPWNAKISAAVKHLGTYDIMRSGRWVTSSTTVDGNVARRLLMDERPQWNGLDDYDLKLRLSKEGPIILLTDVLTAIRVDPSGGSRSRPTLHFARALNVFATWVRNEGWSLAVFRAYLVRWAVTAFFPPAGRDEEAETVLVESFDGSVLGPLDHVARATILAAWRSRVLVPAARRIIPKKLTD